MSHSVDETYDVYNEYRIRARKEHRCAACGETISPGHLYFSVRIVFQGEAETVKRCLRCQRIHQHLRALCRGVEMWPNERLDCGLDYEEEWGNAPPEDVQRVVFLSPDEAQRELGGDNGK